MTIQDELLTAQLAEASYVSNLTPNLTGEPLAKLLRGDKQSPLTSRLAEAISNNFTVVVQRDSSDAFGSGFDATVWRGNEGTPYAGKLYVSMRGSEGGQDFLVDFDLAVNDVGRAQLADMVNWWLRETAPSGEAVRQVRVATNAVGSSQAFFEAAQTGVGTGRLAGTTQIEAVTGHSLGGYLATAFTRLFGGKWSIEDTATFNSAGFTRGSEMPFRELEALLGPGVSLGRFPSTNEQSNYFASNGINVTTNSLWFNQIGHRIEVFNEEGTGISNHSMYKLTDALAVGALLERLDPSLTMAKLNVLLAQGASAPAGSLEGVLDAVRRALTGAQAQAIPIGDTGGNAASREALHATLANLADSPAVQALAGQLVIRPSNGDLRAAARNDFGALVALIDASPLWVTGRTAQSDGALAQVWQTTRSDDYAAWLEDKASAAPTNFTAQWMADRSLLLHAMSVANGKDLGSGDVIDRSAPAGQVTFFHHVDASGQEQVLSLRPSAQAGLPDRHVFFGAHGGDTLTGYDNALGDRLYGMAGDDVLAGLGGGDELEGGAGNDSLNGGGGDDVLSGGKGHDTYVFDGAWGKDAISDADGEGSLRIDGHVLQDARAAGRRNTWVAQVGGQEVVLTVIDDSRSSTGSRLLISRAAPGHSIVIEDFDVARAQREGYLGIRLQPERALILAQGHGANPFGDVAADPSTMGGETKLPEGGGSFFTVYLDRAAVAGERLVLSAGALAGQVEVDFGQGAVAAEGAEIELTPGQTEASFSLVQTGALDADASGVLVARLEGGEHGATSNAWSLTLVDAPDPGTTFTGDYVALVQPSTGMLWRTDRTGGRIVVAQEGDPVFVRDASNNLVAGPGVLVTDNALFGSSNGDDIRGGLGNDVLSGRAGPDHIEGGEGDDMIAGGSGNDTIAGGEGNDFISSAANIYIDHQQMAPGDLWSDWGQAPGATVIASGATWGVYLASGTRIWHGVTPTGTAEQQDFVDAGHGDDAVIASLGPDSVRGGKGNDQL